MHCFDAERTSRLQRFLGRRDVEVRGNFRPNRAPFVAIVCSRLGYDIPLQWQVCQWLKQRCRSLSQQGGTLLIAAESAIEPWAMHAAKRYGACHALVDTGTRPVRPDLRRDIEITSLSGNIISRDAAVIGIADQVDAPYVRQRGTIESCLRQWLGQRRSLPLLVGRKGSAVAKLIERGAIAKTLAVPRDSPGGQSNSARLNDDTSWVDRGQWLIHCTRGCHGPWPDETIVDFRDTMFDDNTQAIGRDAFAALSRIVRMRRLTASAKTSANDLPVVCFSAVGLFELLQRRCYRRHLHRWDYEPYGIAIRLDAAKEIGIRPVVYADTWQQSGLGSAERFRFQSRGRSTDWSAEKEWRSPRTVDLNAISRNDVRVFLHHSARTRLDRLSPCPWPITLIPDLPVKSKRSD